MRVPSIWWTAACTVIDKHDNEWTEYYDVLAPTKQEAADLTDVEMTKRGLCAVDVVLVPCPEKRVPMEAQARPALPAPSPAKAPAPEPFFATAFFTKFNNLTRMATPSKGAV